MKMILCLLFVVSTYRSAFAGDYSSLNRLRTKMKVSYSKAINCLPELSPSGEAKFCSGFKLSKKENKKLSAMSFKACKNIIKKKFGFSLSQEVQPRQLKDAEYSRFVNSTKRAQVYYPEKLVLLKQGTGRIDCVHELLHLYQRFSKNTSINSIPSRSKIEKKMVLELEKHINRVSVLEKRKDIRSAQKISAKLQPYIKFLNKWKGQSYWLHEKEIYYLLYKNCDFFNCSLLDKDIALANLYSLRKYFPWRVRDWLISESAKLIKKKENEVFSVVGKDWVPLIKYKKEKIVQMIETNLEDLQAQLRVKDIYFLKNSLFKEGVICDKGKLIILHKGALDHSLVVAAALRKEQLKKNKKLCEKWRDTRVTSKQFNQGIISREEYEKVVLTSKMAKVHSDLDVYNILFVYQDLFPTDETSLILERWLNAKTSSIFLVWDKKLPKVFDAGVKIRFTEENDLPMFYVNSRKLVLDLGAMDSVIRPIALSTKQLQSMVVLESKTLRTAEGRTTNAPKVMLTTPMMHSHYKLMSTRWVLADLKIIGVDGTFGLNNFSGAEFSIIPKTRTISFSEFKKKPKKALELQTNYKGEYDAVEFKCPEGHIVRLDTGSQVRGDIKAEGLGKNYMKNNLKCGDLFFVGPFEEILSGGPIFSRDVILNLGWPLLRQFKQIDISLKNGWISFKR